MYRIVYLLLGSLLLWACDSSTKNDIQLPYYNEPDFTPIFLEETDNLSKTITHKISDFSFLNQDSVLITEKFIEGKIHVANFIFTKCGIVCPVLTRNLKMVSDSLEERNDIVFLSYSVTPWIDSPSVLKNYQLRNKIKNSNWHFLTGNKTQIYNLARKSYFAEEDIGFKKDSSEFLHTEHFILVDKNKRIRGIYNGTLALEMQQLQDDIISLLK